VARRQDVSHSTATHEASQNPREAVIGSMFSQLSQPAGEEGRLDMDSLAATNAYVAGLRECHGNGICDPGPSGPQDRLDRSSANGRCE
jgi:hypothetical protein